ncbi:MAG: glycosyltransferase [Planctomycetota bacterium]|nr:glycosyltransferase [Planctomycetota bacterium]MDI6787717.1 glycosyltransferase [Planctomycetota bacterium]
MKIFLAGPHWFGNFTEYCASALKKLGCNTKVFFSNKPIRESLEEKIEKSIPYIPHTFTGTIKDILSRRIDKKRVIAINQGFINEALSFSPDVILVISSTGNKILPESIDRLKQKIDVPIVAWFGDDPLRFYQETKNILHYDYLFTGDPTLIAQLKLITKNPVEYLPAAADPDIFKPVKLTDKEIADFGCDIGFVGAASSADGGGLMRAKILETLSSYNLKIYGDPDWKQLYKDFPFLKSAFQGRILPVQETNKLFNAAKIVMNIHHPQNKYWASIRTFEIGASGAFQLADARKGIEDLFKLNEEIVCYRSLPELRELVDYYLGHPEERIAIAQRLRKKVLEKHTYVHRMKTILDYIK